MSDTYKYFDWTFKIPGTRFKIGVTHDIVINYRNDPYLERYILWFGGTLRLHKFWRSDDDRALHDHPWRFITFPLATYNEITEDKDGNAINNTVTRFRPHYRPAAYKHRVIIDKPAWTIIVTGTHLRDWGFYPGGRFVHWSKFPD